jgi:formate/nitrite transporter
MDINETVDNSKQTPENLVIRTPKKIMPKWHASWESHAFESVSKKKALVLSPPELYSEITHLGYEKANYTCLKVMMLSIIAGGYIGLGSTTCNLIGGMMREAPWNPIGDERNYGVFKLVYGALGFPFSFLTILVCGAELYTSQCAYTAAAWWKGCISMLYVFKMLILTWVGNFIGCLMVVGLLYLSEIYDHKDMYLIMLTEDKLSLSWGVVLVRGIFANWLVGIATWMANGALDLSGKAIAVWLPISAFAAIGFEHCIANMFILMMGTAQGAKVTAEKIMWGNIIPATIGNWIGGALFVGTLYSFVYGKPKLKLDKSRFY